MFELYKLKALKKLVYTGGLLIKNLAALCIFIGDMIGLSIERESDTTPQGSLSIKLKILDRNGKNAKDKWYAKTLLSVYTFTVMYRYVIAFRLFDLDDRIFNIMDQKNKK